MVRADGVRDASPARGLPTWCAAAGHGGPEIGGDWVRISESGVLGDPSETGYPGVAMLNGNPHTLCRGLYGIYADNVFGSVRSAYPVRPSGLSATPVHKLRLMVCTSLLLQ